MKIIVNEVPKRSYECPFSKYVYGGYSCKLKKTLATLIVTEDVKC